MWRERRGTYWSNKQLAKTAEDQNIFACFKVNASGRKQLLVAWPAASGGATRQREQTFSRGRETHKDALLLLDAD